MRHLHQSLNINKLEKLYNPAFNLTLKKLQKNYKKIDPKKITCHTCVTEICADSRLRYATYFLLITEWFRMDKVSCVVLIELPNFPNFFRYRD